jgi:small subunit ribosomal protein S8
VNDSSSSAKITEIVRLSKPGRRHYVGVGGIPVVKRGRGIVIVSTSKGIMTGAEAAKQKVGGELICRVY